MVIFFINFITSFEILRQKYIFVITFASTVCTFPTQINILPNLICSRGNVHSNNIYIVHVLSSFQLFKWRLNLYLYKTYIISVNRYFCRLFLKLMLPSNVFFQAELYSELPCV